MVETRGSLIAAATGALSAAGFQDARRHARQLVAAALAISQSDLFGHPDQPVDEHQIKRIWIMIGRVLEDEPLSRIVQRREFWGLQFALSADTLDPRPETEAVVEATLRRIADRHADIHFLDLGTGTGCLLLALLSEFPKALGVGIDIAEGAVRTATYNAAALGFANRALFFVSDWGTAIAGKFDAIVTNPPYLATEEFMLLPRAVACHDPSKALDGGEDGLQAYRAIARDLPRLLADGGIFATEVGVGQADAVAEVVTAYGLVFDGDEKDLRGISRCLIARPG
jgi:release factor glutamine methyltransferase